MTTTISEYINVAQKITDLSCQFPAELALLPANFTSVDSADDFRQPSEAATVRTLLRNAGVPYSDITKDGKRVPYIQNNSFEWISPVLFLSSALLTQNPDVVSIALSVIANYATDFLKGVAGDKSIKLDVVVEQQDGKTCKKISYQGDVEGLKQLPAIIKEISNE